MRRELIVDPGVRKCTSRNTLYSKIGIIQPEPPGSVLRVLPSYLKVAIFQPKLRVSFALLIVPRRPSRIRVRGCSLPEARAPTRKSCILPAFRAIDHANPHRGSRVRIRNRNAFESEIAKRPQFLHIDHADPCRGSRVHVRSRQKTTDFAYRPRASRRNRTESAVVHIDRDPRRGSHGQIPNRKKAPSSCRSTTPIPAEGIIFAVGSVPPP